MQRTTKWVVGAALTVAMVGTGSGFALPTVNAQDDKPLTGSTLGRAVAAALAETGGGTVTETEAGGGTVTETEAGGGTVTETEAGDDGATYGVEIRLKDGRQVEVNLDANFEVIGREPDDDGLNDVDGGNGN